MKPLPWRQTLASLGQRIEALSLRERVALFLSAALMMLALLDHLVLEPSLQAEKQHASQRNAQEAQLRTLRQQLAELTLPDDSTASGPVAQLRQDLAQVQANNAQLTRHLQDPANDGAGHPRNTPLADVLRRVLAQQHQVSLLRLSTRPPVAPPSPAAAASAASSLTATALVLVTPPTPAATASGELASPGWQATELQLSGSYPQLQHTLAELERALPGVRWGELRLNGRRQPAVLQVRLWTQGAQP